MNTNELLSDWRYREQDTYLMNETLLFKYYRKTNGHEHCEFCFLCIDGNDSAEENHQNRGYCTKDERIWVCEKCYNDFHALFHWNE